MGNDKKAAAAGARLQTYPITHGNELKFYLQGSDKPDGTAGAFADVAQAIKSAQHFIFIADWSFQPLTRIEPRTGSASLKDTVGNLLLQATTKNQNLLVAIHTWDHTGAKFPFLGPVAAFDGMNDNGNTVLDAIAGALGLPNKKRPPNLLWRMTSRLHTFLSHHQKFVVLDADNGSGRRVIKAFFGGLDLTKGRFDFGDSPVVPPNPAVEPFALSETAGKFSDDDWYNAEFGDDRTLPRQGWQDFYANIVGPSAWDVLREFVGRWNAISGSALGPKGDISDAARKQVLDKFMALFDKGKFVQAFEPHGGPFTARVVRSLELGEWGPGFKRVATGRGSRNQTVDADTPTENGSTQREFEWKVDGTFEHSIQESYLNAIRNADRFIYIETQYLIGSGDKWQVPQDKVKNQVPETIADKIVKRIEADRDFHAYLVIPMFPEGDPVGVIAQRQRFFELNTMRFMAQTVFKAANAKGKDWKDFLSFYFLVNSSGASNLLPRGKRKDRVRANRRYQLYVHSKLMIVDDQYIILGSANLNERSLAGDRDSEICLSLAADDGQLDKCRQKIGDLRRATWAHHLKGVSIPDLDSPEKTNCSRAIRGAGLLNWTNLAQGTDSPGVHLVHIPFEATQTSFFVKTISPTPLQKVQDTAILDAETDSNDGAAINPDWFWHAPNGSSLPIGVPDSLAE